MLLTPVPTFKHPCVSLYKEMVCLAFVPTLVCIYPAVVLNLLIKLST
jgi:hypothetical protein